MEHLFKKGNREQKAIIAISGFFVLVFTCVLLYMVDNTPDKTFYKAVYFGSSITWLSYLVLTLTVEFVPKPNLKKFFAGWSSNHSIVVFKTLVVGFYSYITIKSLYAVWNTPMHWVYFIMFGVLGYLIFDHLLGLIKYVNIIRGETPEVKLIRIIQKEVKSLSKAHLKSIEILSKAINSKQKYFASLEEGLKKNKNYEEADINKFMDRIDKYDKMISTLEIVRDNLGMHLEQRQRALLLAGRSTINYSVAFQDPLPFEPIEDNETELYGEPVENVNTAGVLAQDAFRNNTLGRGTVEDFPTSDNNFAAASAHDANEDRTIEQIAHEEILGSLYDLQGLYRQEQAALRRTRNSLGVVACPNCNQRHTYTDFGNCCSERCLFTYTGMRHHNHV